MTEREKLKFLKTLKNRKTMSRKEIFEYFNSNPYSSDPYHKVNETISSLLYSDLIVYKSEPIYESGRLHLSSDDVFSISDHSKDIVYNFNYDRLKTWYPYVVSTLALITAIVSIIMQLWTIIATHG